MKTHTAALAALSLCAPAAGAAAATSDAAQIRALETRFERAVSAKDVAAIMRAYASDVFVFDLVPPRQYVGAAAYQKDWETLLAGYKGKISFKVADLAVSASGPVAWSHSVQTLTGAGADGKEQAITVRVTDVYRRTAAGWRIVQEHVSVPVDLASGKPDLTSAP